MNIKKKTLCTLLSIALLAASCAPALSLLPPTVSAVETAPTALQPFPTAGLTIDGDTPSVTYQAGEGTVEWNKEKNTLIMNNANINIVEDNVCHFDKISNPIIQLIGTNTITHNSSAGYGIRSDEPFTITSDDPSASLSIMDKEADGTGIGAPSFTIENARVNVISQGYVTDANSVNINGGSLFVDCTFYDDKQFTVTGSPTESSIIYTGRGTTIPEDVSLNNCVHVPNASYDESKNTITCTYDDTNPPTVYGDVEWNKLLQDFMNEILKPDAPSNLSRSVTGTPKLVVPAGATLTIPAGVKAVIPQGVVVEVKGDTFTEESNAEVHGFVVKTEGGKTTYTAHGNTTLDFDLSLTSSTLLQGTTSTTLTVANNIPLTVLDSEGLTCLETFLQKSVLVIQGILQFPNTMTIDSLPTSNVSFGTSGKIQQVSLSSTESGTFTSSVVDTFYDINVINGTLTGSRLRSQGENVTVTANAAPSGQKFDRWTVDGVSLTEAELNNATLSFTMPNKNVTITANYAPVSSNRPNRRPNRPSTSVSSSTPSVSSTPSSNPGQSGSDTLFLDTAAVETANGNHYDFLVLANHDSKNIKVTVDNPQIATVQMQNPGDPRGCMYRIQTLSVGRTTIRVSYRGKTATIALTVREAAGSITLDTISYKMSPGKNYTIGAFLRDASGNALTPTQIADMIKNGKLSIQDSRNGSVVDMQLLENGYTHLVAREPGVCYILYTIQGRVMSVRIEVQNGVLAGGQAVRDTFFWF